MSGAEPDQEDRLCGIGSGEAGDEADGHESDTEHPVETGLRGEGKGTLGAGSGEGDGHDQRAHHEGDKSDARRELQYEGHNHEERRGG